MNIPLDEKTLILMGFPKHKRGTEWPTEPFCITDEGEGNGAAIRWNNSDCVQALGEVFWGRADRDTVEWWRPSYDMDQAMRLWKEYPPKTQWLKIQIGEDGWTIELLYHNWPYGDALKYSTDDYKEPGLSEAITLAWVTAMESV